MLYWYKHRQVCILVGCVPPPSVAATTCQYQRRSLCVCVCWGGLCHWGSLSRGSLFPGGSLSGGRSPPPREQNDWQTGVKTSFKLLLHLVTRQFCTFAFLGITLFVMLSTYSVEENGVKNHPVTRCLSNKSPLPTPNQIFCGLQMWSSDLDTSNPTRLWVSLKLKIPWLWANYTLGGVGVKCRYANFTLRLVDYHELRVIVHYFGECVSLGARYMQSEAE